MPEDYTYDVTIYGDQAAKQAKAIRGQIVNELAGETYHFLNKFLYEDFALSDFQFSYAIGIDNACTFEKWINYDYLKDLIQFIVIHRQGEKRYKKVNWFSKEPHKFFDAKKKIPKISSTQIREMLHENRDSFFDEPYNRGVADIIQDNKLYI